MSGGYDLHPEAFIDIDEIAVYIGQGSREAAHRIVDRFTAPSKMWFRFLTVATADQTSRTVPCGLSASGIT
jgi:hypothetical protein